MILDPKLIEFLDTLDPKLTEFLDNLDVFHIKLPSLKPTFLTQKPSLTLKSEFEIEQL